MHLTSISTADPHRATMLSELTRPERLIVSAFRRWILGWVENDASHWKLVSHDFVEAFGPRGATGALASFGHFVNILRLNASRPIEYHHPCCPCLGVDEACLIVVVAACQHGDGVLARAAAGWLVTEEAAGDLLCSGNLLGRAMRDHLPALPNRALRAPSGSARLH
jgi:hypothetical protein